MNGSDLRTMQDVRRQGGENDREFFLRRLCLIFKAQLYDAGLFQSCLNCVHFNEASELCGLVNQRPPARVIALGCPQHSDEIPF